MEYAAVMFELTTARGVLAALALVALWTAEAAWPMFIGRKQRGGHYVRNLALGVFNAVVVAGVFAAALLFITEHSRTAHFGLLHRLEAPPLVVWALAFIAIDFWQYCWHVLNHKLRFLWRFHAVHHSDAELDASTALRFHTGEIAMSAIVRLAVLPLLGVTIVQLAVYELVLLPIILFHHSNVRVPAKVDRWLRVLIVTPWMHWVHHSDYQPETDSNYASVLSVWDRLFRTFRLRENPLEIGIGLKDFPETEWRPLKSVFAIPFKHSFGRRRDE